MDLDSKVRRVIQEEMQKLILSLGFNGEGKKPSFKPASGHKGWASIVRARDVWSVLTVVQGITIRVLLYEYSPGFPKGEQPRERR